MARRLPAMDPLGRLTVQQLLHLDALVRERHVTRAAERMGVGQPAMSAALARLREALHDPLLVKTSAGMEPTPRALELAERVRELHASLGSQGADAGAFDPLACDRRLRILSSDGISRLVLPELMNRLAVRAPHVRLLVTPGDQRRLGEYLRDGDIDLGWTSWRDPPADLRQAPLYGQRLVCIARLGHPAIGERLTLETFLGQAHVTWGAPPVPHATMEALVDERLAALGHERQVALRVSSILLLPEVVARSELLAVVSERAALSSGLVGRLAMHPLPFDCAAVDVSMVWHERQHHDPGHAWFRRLVREVATELDARFAGPDAA